LAIRCFWRNHFESFYLFNS